MTTQFALSRPTRPRLKAREYRIAWHWREYGDNPLLFDHYSATTVERAIAKFRKAMHADYSFDNNDLVIVGVYPTEGINDY